MICNFVPNFTDMRVLTRHINRFEKKHGHKPFALITGGSSGMGLQYARFLAAEGCNLLLVSNQQQQLEEQATQIAKEFNVSVISHFQDLAAADAAESLVKFCDEQKVEIDILINNAGMFFFKEHTAALMGKIDAILGLHINTVTKLSVLFGEKMKARGYGYILIVSSMASRLPMPGITTYSATKAYLRSFGRSLYFEMREYGVGVTTVCPGAIATPLYNLNPKLLQFGVRIKVIGTPQWLVRRALHRMFHRRRLVQPGAMNVYLPPLIAILPKVLVGHLWGKFKQ